MTDRPYFQPLSSTEIITGALRLYRDHLALLVIVALIPHLVSLAMGLWMPPLKDMTFAHMASMSLVNLLIIGVTFSALTYVICFLAVGKSPSLKKIYSLTLRGNLLGSILVLIIVNVMFSMMLMPILIFQNAIGVLLGMVPALLVGGVFSCAVPIAVIENRWPFDAMGVSLKLVRGEVAKGVVVFIFFVFIVAIIPLFLLFLQAIFLQPSDMDKMPPLTPLLSAILGAVTLPLGYTSWVLLYFSLRAREGMPPDRMAEEIESVLGVPESTD